MDASQVSPVTVLCVDNEPGLATLIGNYLERTNEAITAITAKTVDTAISTFSNEKVDCVISNHNPSGINGLELLDRVRSLNNALPFILFTNQQSEEIASEAVTRGVTDYMQLSGDIGQYDGLVTRVIDAVEQYRSSGKGTSVDSKAETLFTESSDQNAGRDESDAFVFNEDDNTSPLLIGEDAQKQQDVLTQTNRELDEFATTASQELRSPLETAVNRLDLVMNDLDREDYNEIRDALSSMDELIEAMVSLSQAGKVVTDTEPVSLSTMVDACWPVVETEDVLFVVESDCEVFADESRLQQLFEILIQNAVTHGGSDVTITIGCDGTGFYVEDSGSGVLLDDLDERAGQGCSAMVDGTSIRLRTVQKISEAHGWSVTSKPSSSGGSRFDFHLPGSDITHVGDCTDTPLVH